MKQSYYRFIIYFLFTINLSFINAQDSLIIIDEEPERKIKMNKWDYTAPSAFTITFDQDFFYFLDRKKNDDRNYTQGAGLAYTSRNLLHTCLFAPLKAIKDLTNDDNITASVSINGTAFTPRIIDSSKPIVGDRPFAFLFYLSTSSTQRHSKMIRRNGKIFNREIFNTYTINYGLLGTNIGYQFQGWAHKNIVTGRSTNPIGWNTQISKGGSVTFLLDYNRFQNLLSLPKTDDTANDDALFDIGWNAGGSFGYYNKLNTGLYSRFGKIKRSNQALWNLSRNNLNSGANEVYKNEGKKLNPQFWEFFLYNKTTLTAMARNSFLSGQMFRDSKDEYQLDNKMGKAWHFRK